VLFDITLADGSKPIRAEGRAVSAVPATGDRPGGLIVRFKRFGTATKAFVERAVALRLKKAEGASAPERYSMPEAVPAELPSAPIQSSPCTAPVSPHSLPAPAPPPASIPPSMQSSGRESSGLRRRVVAPVSAPANREELLERLRRRVRSAG
jgi:hypothetical protein